MKIINNKIKKTAKGSALALVLVMITIVAMILSSLMVYVNSQIRYSHDRVEREKAFQIAEAGAYYYRWYLAHQIAGKTAEQIADFWENGNPEGVGTPHEAEYSDPEGGAIGKYKLEVVKPVLGSTIATVKSTGWTYNQPSAKKIVQVRFRRPSWSENTVLANDNMRFGVGTTVTGKIHSNGGIRFDGYANNTISSALVEYDDLDHDDVGAEKLEFGVHTHVNAPPGSGVNNNYRPNEMTPHAVDERSDVFSGREFPVPVIDFNSVVSDISYMRSKASIKYDNTGKGRRIILKTDGTFDMCKVNTYSAISDANYSAGTATQTNGITDYNGVVIGASSGNGSACVTTSCCTGASCPWIQNSNHNKGKCESLSSNTIPNNGVIFVANNAWIEGTIDAKKVTIVAAELSDESGYTGGKKNIFLGINNLLYTNVDGSDIIGLIAQDNITIVRDSQNMLTIDGALLAKEGRVGRCLYDGTSKNTITINGSLATNIRYGFAYVYANGSFAEGYINRNLNFDNNLLYYPPPFFPTGTEYAIDLWDELQ